MAKKICFIGDSRTVMLEQALESSGTVDMSNFIFIAQGSMGYEWLVDTAIPSFNSQSSNIETCVIFQLGVNNINTSEETVSQRAVQYKDTYNSLANNNQDINFYFCSVGPVDETKDAYVTYHNRNEWIEQFNSYLSSNLNSKWTVVDLYTYLVSDGFKPTSDDGLHYTNSVTLKMFNFVMDAIDDSGEPEIIDISKLNNGEVKTNPYGKVTQIIPSFKNIDYYDCYIPYKLTNEQLGGYKETETVDPTPGQEATYPPMADQIKRMRVANYINLEERYNYPSNIQAAIDSGAIRREYSSEFHCHYIEKNGVKFFEMAVQPFYLRRSIGTGSPSSTDGYFPYSTENRGQIIDVILTSGKCIHFILADVNSAAHTNCGTVSHNEAHDGFAATNYSQYHNIISAIAGNSIELLGEGSQQWSEINDYANRKFASKYNLGTWGTNGTYDIAFYRVYNHRVQDSEELEVSKSYMTGLDYDIVGDSEYDPPTPEPEPEPEPEDEDRQLPVIQERGIFNVKVDWDRWKVGTNLIRIGDYVKLKATKSQGKVTWYDITDPEDIQEFSNSQLKEKYGISYTQVNDGFIGKFYVQQKPLSEDLGGTGVSDLKLLFQASTGVFPGEYDYSELPATSVGDGTIDLPNLAVGHILSAEARTDENGSIAPGDQGQSSSGLDTTGECSFVYDRDLKQFTNTYRLYSSSPTVNALCKQVALKAANHACFLVQNPRVGYNFVTSQKALEQYISNNKGNIQFSNFNVPSDTNCMNLCKLAYMAAWPSSVLKQNGFNDYWTTNGILSSNTLENLGFRKFDSAYTHNPLNMEIGDIVVKNGHALMVVGVGGKNWVLNGVDYSPSKGEVKT